VNPFLLRVTQRDSGLNVQRCKAIQLQRQVADATDARRLALPSEGVQPYHISTCAGSFSAAYATRGAINEQDRYDRANAMVDAAFEQATKAAQDISKLEAGIRALCSKIGQYSGDIGNIIKMAKRGATRDKARLVKMTAQHDNLTTQLMHILNVNSESRLLQTLTQLSDSMFEAATFESKRREHAQQLDDLRNKCAQLDIYMGKQQVVQAQKVAQLEASLEEADIERERLHSTLDELVSTLSELRGYDTSSRTGTPST